MSLRILVAALSIALAMTFVFAKGATAQKGAVFGQKANERFDKRAEMAKKKQQTTVQKKTKKKAE